LRREQGIGIGNREQGTGNREEREVREEREEKELGMGNWEWGMGG